jgi:hypothetical protein
MELFMKIGDKEYTRDEIEKRIGNVDQLGGTRSYDFSEGPAKGVSAVEFTTGSGLHFTVLPDRGLDIPFCSYKGVNLVYITPNGVVNPAFYEPEGLGWLRTFFGGLLTTCGLTYFGAPGRDGDEELGLHGRYSTAPARGVRVYRGWENDEYLLEISGTVEEATLFGDKLRLTRTVSTRIGERWLRIHDAVHNFGFRSSPFTILYHINPGFPLLDESCELLLTSTKTEPYDDVSKRGFKDWNRFSAPMPNYSEQNFLHTMKGDENHYALAALINRSLGSGLGLYLRFRVDSLPFLSEWKMMGEGDYVLGIEPCNTKIENRAWLRKNGRLPEIRPGEKREMELEVGVLDGQNEIDTFQNRAKEILG